ncbi:hypothetical protein V1264_023626 [Littorina saxatilis]|uniref:KICSTOR complex protein SZT2 n=1 Tax=Littorina saxatilis TaxID=31220 RepID=A0AAN9B899_9CAEN
MEDDDGENDSSADTEAAYVDAEEVFVLMKKNTRVSRNIRACWFFRHLKSTIIYTPLLELHLNALAQDLTLASLIPADGEPMFDASQTYKVGINPHTTVTFLASRYRIAFTLDLSPSVVAVDVAKGQLVSDEIFQNFCKCLKGLVKPFHLPGSRLVFRPKLFIAVIAHTPVVCSAANQVLIQGVSVSEENVEQILQYAYKELLDLEHHLAGSFTKIVEQLNARKPEPFFLEEEEEEEENRANLVKMTDEILRSHELALVDMLRCGMLCLQMLPENSSSVIVVITDGVVGVPEANLMELLLTQLRNSTISCSFLKVSSPISIQRQLGHVPNFELMQFIATATFGGYFLSCPDVGEDESFAPNVYHQAMYYWSFQKGLEGFCYDGSHNDPDIIGSPSWVHRRLYSHPLHGGSFGLDVMRKKHQERNIQAGLSHVLSVRLREGYTIKAVHFHKGGSEIEVNLVLPWRDNGKIEYNATAPWPLEKNKTSRVEIFVEGSYDFLHELMCRSGNRKLVASPFRSAHIKKFWQVLTHISSTDKLLVHLQSFDTNPVNYEVPEYIRSGIPLFVLDPVNPVTNSQLSNKESELAGFVSFWEPVIMLDTNIWQKWMHSHRLGLVLEQDLPLPRYLHVPNSSGRFNILQCRQALASLTQLLKHWCTFVLAENHSYIKFMERGADKPPAFFCLLRVTSKPPYVILRLAFLGGTPSNRRREEIRQLKLQLSELKFPKRYTQKSEKKSTLKVAADNGKEKERKAPLLREWSEINCCTVLRKPVEKILIRYEQKPEDLFVVEDRPRPSLDDGSGSSVSQGRSAVKQPVNSKFNTLSHYLIHRRWVWSVQLVSSVPLSLHTVGKMLQTLTKIRLQEGFHFASTNSGISNMVLEVDMMDNRFTAASSSQKEEFDDEHQTCVVQYIVFPPHTKTSRDSVSEEDMDEMETTEADGEVQIVTECWVEPQFGFCINNTPERLHFEGLTNVALSNAFFDVDYECISSLTTFNHLLYLCQHAAKTPSLGTDVTQSGTSSSPSTPGRRHTTSTHIEEDEKHLESTVTFIPFPFDLLTLLPCSQQAELLFSTFVVGTGKAAEKEAGADPKGSNELLFSLLFEKFRTIHDREHFVSTEVADKFLEQLCSRPRDLTQQPFPFQCKHSTSNQNDKPDLTEAADGGATPETNDKGQRATPDRPTSGTSSAPNTLRGATGATKSAKTASNSQTNARTSDHTASGAHGSTPGSARFSQNGSVHGQPMWKCYTKAVSTGHMLLTFIPASYDDLLLLNKTEEEKEGPCAGHERKSGDSEDITSPRPQTTDCPGDTATEEDSATGATPATATTTATVAYHVSEDTDSCTTGQMSGEGRRGSSALSGAEHFSTTLITVTEPSPCQSPERTVAQSREDDVKEWVNTSCSAAVPPAKGPMVIPVYVYDCHLHSVTESLVNRWTFTLPPDLFEDMTFTADGDDNQPTPSPRGRLASFDKEMSVIEEKEEAEYLRPSWRSSLDRKSMDNMTEGVGDFKQHCHLITESFFSCFVSGLYQSLRHNYYVHQHDMDAAINSICQETLPLEVDMTSFLLASCGHLNRLVSQARRELAASKEGEFSRKHSVRFLEVVEIQSDDGEDIIVPEILQLPRRMVSLLPSLWSDMTCEHSLGLHKQVEEKFMEIVKHWFQPVDSMPDYFFFSPVAQQRTSRCEDYEDREKRDSTDEKTDENQMDTDNSTKEEDEADIVMAEFTPRGHTEIMERGNHSACVSVDSNLDVSLSDLDIQTAHDLEQEVVPLFVHFTCTLKRRTEHHNTSVTAIPQCLRDLLCTMKDPLLAIDFGEFKVTFDINCLTLPSDQDLDLPLPKKPGFLRSFSNQSQGSGSGRQSECENDETQSNAASSEYNFGDPLGHLPAGEREAVLCFKNEVEWLLYDEIASALRHMFPINSDALEFVTQHVKKSCHHKYTSAIHERVNLQFVYGPDRSLKPFTEEFERMSLPGYHLTKVTSFYILTIDRAHANNIRHAQALKTALVELSHGEADGSSPVAADCNKLFPAIEERSHSLPNILGSPVPGCPVGVTAVQEARSVGSGGGGGSSDENRPRSSSDEKYPKDILADEIRLKQMPVQSMLTAKDIDSDVSDALLRKSHSFAGLHGQVTFAPSTATISPEVHHATLSTVKASPSSLFGIRSRHFSAPSGQGTPQSRASTLPQTPSMGSSHGSGTSDAGFEGDVSDDNMDDTASLSDAGLMYPPLPNFWLIMIIHSDSVELFFHTRESGGEASVQQQQKALVSGTIQSIHDICQKINKQLLLDELLETQMCNLLLVPEADEDVHWTDRSRTISSRSVQDAFEGDDEDEAEEGQNRGYLAAAMNFEAGYFACDCVWRKLFFLHPRLKTGSQRQGMSRGLVSLRSILNKFAVGNRKNMFVIKETSSGNVFYLKLKELTSSNLYDPLGIDIQADLETSMSELSLSSHFQTMKANEPSKMEADTRSEGDTTSLASGYSRFSSRIEDMVELTVHGIEEPGKEIQEDLMKVLQNKLDDTVLDVISVMLARNPQCKLRPDDVQFIQCPVQDATETLQLTIPSHAMPFLSALLYYLRQNLLQFLHTPNFQEDSLDYHFHDFIEGQWQPITNDQVYLYISPQAGGRKGMACVSCSLVDGRGNSVRLLSCPCPSRLAASNLPTANEFTHMVETCVHEHTTCRVGPGPTALVQFRIWQRGSLDMRQLKDRLTSAVGHALCDIVMEFTLLTAPVCTTPRNLQDIKTLPVTSLPSSPVTVKKVIVAPREEPERKPALGRKMSDTVRISLKPIPQSASPFQTLRDTFTSRSKLGSPAPENAQSFDWSQVQNQTDHSRVVSASLPSNNQSDFECQELQELIAQYDKGEKGSLHPAFASLMEPWLHFCQKRNMPSVSKMEMSIRADHSVEYILKELQNALPSLGVKSPLRVFKVLHYATLDSSPFSVPFYPCKPQPSSLEEQLEMAMESVGSDVGKIKWTAVVRDHDLWCLTVSPEPTEYQQTQTVPSMAELRGFQSSQKFTPKCYDPAKDRDSYEALTGMNQTFIPRQKLLIMFAYEKKFVVYMYNFGSEVTSGVDKTVKRIVHWHNARSHLLNSLLSQKMGLFRHSCFSELPFSQEDNPYTSTNDIDNLIKFSAPPREVNRRHSSMTTAQSRSISRVLNQYRPFDETYKNLKPAKPMHKNVVTSRDHVVRHGMQAQDIRSRYRKDAELVMKLQHIYVSWLQKSGANPPMSEDYLDLLKQSSRLFHYCATPLLFCPQWRQCVLDQSRNPKATPTPPPPTPEKEPVIVPKSRSRHSSGASISSLRARRSSSQDVGRAKRTSDPSPAPPSAAGVTSAPGGVGMGSDVPTGPGPDDSWHRDICHNFLMQYRNYLVTEFGFININLQQSMHKRPVPAGSSREEESSQRHLVVNLQKTLTCGIILMELSLRSKYFFLKMFVLDYLQLGISNHDMQLLFVDECEKYKDLIHVHSFAHDFHLRCINDYLRGSSSILHPGFHLSNFLTEFLNIYPDPPSFARNCLAKESKEIFNLPCPGPQLYDYMRNQSRQFDMSVFRMTPSDVFEPDYCCIKGDEFALVQIREPDRPSLEAQAGTLEGAAAEVELDGYNVTLIISQDALRGLASVDAGKELLKLNFFVVLTRLRDFHPKRTLEKKFGDFRCVSTNQQSHSEGSDTSSMGGGEGDPGVPIAVKQHLGARQEHTNYLGFSNIHLARVYTLLNTQIKAGKDKIEEVVEMSKVKCRRDYLWHRMLSSAAKDDGKGKKGKQPEESLEPNMTPLSAAEFEELLSLVSKQPLNQIDPRLAIFSNMPPAWYSSLLPVLTSRFTNACRFFATERQFQHHTVILNSKWLDMFILLSVDQNTGCTALSQVLRSRACDEEEQNRRDQGGDKRRQSVQGRLQDQQPEREGTPSLITEQKHCLIEDFVNVCCFHLWSSIL